MNHTINSLYYSLTVPKQAGPEFDALARHIMWKRGLTDEQSKSISYFNACYNCEGFANHFHRSHQFREAKRSILSLTCEIVLSIVTIRHHNRVEWTCSHAITTIQNAMNGLNIMLYDRRLCHHNCYAILQGKNGISGQYIVAYEAMIHFSSMYMITFTKKCSDIFTSKKWKPSIMAY
jgi:hypothetical protein